MTAFVIEAFGRADGKRGGNAGSRREAADPVHDKHTSRRPAGPDAPSSMPGSNGPDRRASIAAAPWLAAALATENGPFDIQWDTAARRCSTGTAHPALRDSAPRSYLLAVDKTTGKDRWKTDRGQGRASYSTPLVIEGAFGAEIIVNSTERIDAYDPKTGAFLWHAGETSRFAVPSPVFDAGVIYASRGYRSGPYMAIKPGGRGDATKTQMVWNVATGAPYVSHLYYDRLCTWQTTSAC